MAKWIMVEKMRKKGKKNRWWKTKSGLVRAFAAFAVCILSGGIWTVPVIADAQTTVSLTAEGNQAEVSLELPAQEQTGQQGYGGTKALQLGFQVNILHGEGEEYQVSFLFDEGIRSSVKQYSYQEEIGLLQIYLSGEQNLYESGGITLGKIVVESKGSVDVTASIRVAEDSLKTVNDAFDLKEQPFSATEMVQVTTAGKQAGKANGADREEAIGTETGNPQEGTDQSESGSAGGGSDSKENAAGEAEPTAGGSETPEQEPLLRLVRTEKTSRFSMNRFSLQSLFADRKARIVLGVVAVAVAALILGTITRAVHNRKKKKKKWW